jgi:hypothetical protein
MAESERACGPSTLYVPVAQPRSVWLATGALMLAYAVTMARDLSFYDSGELALAAVVLGLGHPPGQPLHTLLGFVLSKVPLWSPVVGVVLASAIPGALTIVPASSLAHSLMGPSASVRARSTVPWLLAALGLHASIWEPATRVEVYALATFFAVWAVAKLAAPRAEVVTSDGGKRAALRVLAAAVALGLCASTNPMTAVCVAGAVAPELLRRVVRRELPWYALALAVAGGLCALAPYAYVPLIAARQDVLLWGAPRDAAGLAYYFSGQDYAHNRSIDAATWLAHLGAWLWDCLMRGFGAWLALGILGHAMLRKRTELGALAAPLTLLFIAALVASNTVWSLDVPDYDGYLAAGVWVVAAGTAALWAELASVPERTRAGHLVIVLLVLSAALPAPNVLGRTRYRDHVARELAERVLHEAPQRAIVITFGDSIASPLLYVQEAEAVRRDVVVLAFGLASSSWHWDHIAKRHKDLAPFALRGPGGRGARVRRFVEAQPDRVVLVESAAVADEIGLPACAYGLYLRLGASCQRPLVSPMTENPSQLLARLVASVGSGSPSALDALSLISFELGVSLWRVGQPYAAYETLLAGVPLDELPPVLTKLTPEAKQRLANVPTLAAALPAWERHAALGDPSRNLFLIAMMFNAAGLGDHAIGFMTTAHTNGLPEASN